MINYLSGSIGISVRYLRHFLKSLDEHSLQAPFIFDLYSNIIKEEKKYYIFDEIETLRSNLLNDERTLEVRDFGAGSRISKVKKKSIKEIAQISLSSRKVSRLLFRLVNYYKPDSIIELGTSLGINTLYLASYSNSVPVFTFEGCNNIAQVAKGNFQAMGKKNITIIEGNIDKTFPEFLKQRSNISFIYIDANHQYEATLRYFNLAKEKSNEHTILVFDDINWSQGMNKAWTEICNDSSVGMSIDLFTTGIIFFKKFLLKQHYVLSY
jgi:predicted O-methyltransferase YrrM